MSATKETSDLRCRRELLTERYLHGELPEEDFAELEAALRGDDGGFRRWFIETIRLHQVLDEHFAADDWMATVQPLVAHERYGSGHRALVFLPAAAVAVLAFVWLLHLLIPDSASDDPVARVRCTSELAGESGGYAPGSVLRRGTHRISGGILEFEFASGVVVALQGPSEVQLLGGDRMRLVRGVMSADVPKQGVGFIVETPSGRIVDLGTSFGVRVGENGQAEAQVRKGTILVESGDHVRRVEAQTSVLLHKGGGAEYRPGLSGSSYPVPSGRVLYTLENGDFEASLQVAAGRPQVAGQWSGDAVGVVSETFGIKPFSGPCMLQFLGTLPPGQLATATATASQLMQLIDLRDAAAQVGGGPMKVEFSARFNRVAGNARTDTRFAMIVHALAAEPISGELVRILPGQSTVLDTVTDSDPVSWERADLTSTLPPGTKWLVLELVANENIHNDEAPVEFDGHFVDDVHLRVLSGDSAVRGD
jgi:hypothetical protein